MALSLFHSELLRQAKDVSKQSYPVYSKFRVGCAVMNRDKGTIHTGCNVENASYGLTICAERAAICNAVANGAQTISRVVIYTPTKNITMPCGACLQFIKEFENRTKIMCFNQNEEYKEFDLHDLLPHPF